MKNSLRKCGVLLLASGLTFNPLIAMKARPFVLQTHKIAPDPNAFTLTGVSADFVRYRGRNAIHLSARQFGDYGVAVLKNYTFQNGVAELEIAGVPIAHAPPEARGYVGITFRGAPDATAYEYVYLRPTNGRANDQLRRNHATQYASYPDYPALRLRQESPGLYESYVDLEPGAWTKFKLVFKGRTVSLYVHGSTQPCLIVNDLKLGEGNANIGL